MTRRRRVNNVSVHPLAVGFLMLQTRLSHMQSFLLPLIWFNTNINTETQWKANDSGLNVEYAILQEKLWSEIILRVLRIEDTSICVLCADYWYLLDLFCLSLIVLVRSRSEFQLKCLSIEWNKMRPPDLQLTTKNYSGHAAMFNCELTQM